MVLGITEISLPDVQHTKVMVDLGVVGLGLQGTLVGTFGSAHVAGFLQSNTVLELGADSRIDEPHSSVAARRRGVAGSILSGRRGLGSLSTCIGAGSDVREANEKSLLRADAGSASLICNSKAGARDLSTRSAPAPASSAAERREDRSLKSVPVPPTGRPGGLLFDADTSPKLLGTGRRDSPNSPAYGCPPESPPFRVPPSPTSGCQLRAAVGVAGWSSHA